ncbi:FmdB family zinc ribbon protein [Methyloversatilis thermotolerans]|uniref:FmdB family zinc ribbon protein n=1 Tax=Methyloversatilis thermotolerans TaxID=1346290 RepID=UPI000374F513|nr:FmdB family zinc ribbon protein [Methyloversatilis thermotolerans]
MPIYGYRCTSCGFEKDVMQKISAAPLTDCPSCGASTFTKQLSAAGFQLKGSGWYVTDFRGNGSGSSGSSSGGTAGEGGGAPAGKSEAAAPSAESSSSAPATPCGGSCACH